MSSWFRRLVCRWDGHLPAPSRVSPCRCLLAEELHYIFARALEPAEAMIDRIESAVLPFIEAAEQRGRDGALLDAAAGCLPDDIGALIEPANVVIAEAEARGRATGAKAERDRIVSWVNEWVDQHDARRWSSKSTLAQFDFIAEMRPVLEGEALPVGPEGGEQ